MSLKGPVSCVSDAFSFLLLFFLINLLELLFFNELYLFDDESDDDGSESGSPGTCKFSFCSGNFVGRFNGVGSGVFVTTGIESIGGIVPFIVFVTKSVDFKGCQLIEIFWRPES